MFDFSTLSIILMTVFAYATNDGGGLWLRTDKDRWFCVSLDPDTGHSFTQHDGKRNLTYTATAFHKTEIKQFAQNGEMLLYNRVYETINANGNVCTFYPEIGVVQDKGIRLPRGYLQYRRILAGNPPPTETSKLPRAKAVPRIPTQKADGYKLPKKLEKYIYIDPDTGRRVIDLTEIPMEEAGK